MRINVSGSLFGIKEKDKLLRVVFLVLSKVFLLITLSSL